MTEEEVDLRIRNALLAAATAEAAPLPGETEPPIPLSLRRRMRHLLSDPFGKKLLEASQRMGGAALSEQGWLPRGDSGIWTRVARFLGRHTPLKPPAGAGPDAPLTGWAPAWLPEGYAPVSTQYSPALRQSLYARGEESLTFTASAGDGPLPVEQEGREERPISVAGRPGYLLPHAAPGGPTCLVWFEEAEGVVFTLTGALPEEELLQVAASVKKTPG